MVWGIREEGEEKARDGREEGRREGRKEAVGGKVRRGGGQGDTRA